MTDISRKDFLGLSTVTAAGLASGCAPIAAEVDVMADLVVVGGKVLTQEADQSSVDAFAVKNGRFMAVGSNEDIRNLTSVNTEVIDVSGMTVLPG
ncbi:MAG TPA: amidohydrolase, partial [Gemmatimonadetes bacterium]|nr:amidohydrolase [Gemmatimonadota bacterium]